MIDMKCTGKAKLLNIEFEVKRTVGDIYFSTKVGEDDKGNPQFETDFCHVVFLGKAHDFIKELAKLEDLEKYPIYITESQLRLKSGQRKDKSYWNYNELVVFDFEEVKQEEEEVKPKGKSRNRSRR